MPADEFLLRRGAPARMVGDISERTGHVLEPAGGPRRRKGSFRAAARIEQVLRGKPLLQCNFPETVLLAPAGIERAHERALLLHRLMRPGMGSHVEGGGADVEAPTLSPKVAKSPHNSVSDNHRSYGYARFSLPLGNKSRHSRVYDMLASIRPINRQLDPVMS